jgi:hypothetical protein
MSQGEIEKRIAPYRKAMETGTPYREPGFFAASGFQDGYEHFSKGANISFVINAIHDGTGQGRAVDQYKNDNIEGEVLWGPNMGQFSIDKITDRPDPNSFTKFPIFQKGELSPEELAGIPEYVRGAFDGTREPTSEEFHWLRDLVDLDDDIFDDTDEDSKAYLKDAGLDSISPEVGKKLIDSYFTYKNPEVHDPTRHSTVVYMTELPQNIPPREKYVPPAPKQAPQNRFTNRFKK